MIFRFSLYGFLKNQRYFEAFLYLAFLAKGLDFFQIGMLVAFRALAVNLMEMPSGSIADVFGRRRTLIASLSSYVGGFLVLGAADHIAALSVGMALLGLGDSFRSGTHKAMIFTWLSDQNRTDERVWVYGHTRSWSKFGSAVSVVVGTAIVLVTGEYSWVFYAAVVPYLFGIANIVAYPRALEGTARENPSLVAAARHLATALGAVVRRPGLRRLVAESMGFDGVFAAVKDYLQPVLEAAAISMAATVLVGSKLSETQRTALLVGPVYVVLHLLSGLASRRAHRVSEAAGGDDHAARALWGVSCVVFAGVLAAGWFDVLPALIVTFVALHVLHNVWRPILISRFDTYGDASQGAAILSIESQSQRVATMILAPVLGLALDWSTGNGLGGAFWPLGAAGLIISLALFATAWMRRTSQ